MIHVVRGPEAQRRTSFGVAFDLLAVGQQCMMTRMHYRVGNVIPFHAHPNEQIGYLESGRIRVLTRTTVAELGAGDSYAIPAAVEHGIEIIEDAEEVQVFSPPRAEFIRTADTDRESAVGPADPVRETMAFRGYRLIVPEDLQWRPSNLMRIPNADYLERTGSELLGARLWRVQPGHANTLHKHVRAEEFYFVLEGTGRIRVGGTTLTVPRHGAVLVAPDQLRQVFNDTDVDALWLIVGAPEEREFLQGSRSQGFPSPFYPVDPTQLPPELERVRGGQKPPC